MDFRKDFWELILDKAKKDKDIVVLTADLGYSYCEEFQSTLPEQFINVGCCEQNMILVAGGLSICGFKPYCYTNSVFLLRTYEMIRNVCNNKLDVKFVGTGASGFLGFSHNLLEYEDGNVLGNIPNLKLCFPECREGVRNAINSKGATYIKI